MNFKRILIIILILLSIIDISSSTGIISTNSVVESSDKNPFIFKEIGFIKFPLFNTPSLIFPGEMLNITTGLSENDTLIIPNYIYEFVEIQIKIPETAIPGLYSLYINTSSGSDYSYHSICVYSNIPTYFSIVHITDSHIGAKSYNTSRDLESAVKIINFIHPALIVHTGDLIDGGVGSKNETLINERYKEAFTILSDLESPIFIINGNHEDYAGMPRWEAYMGSIYQASTDFGPIHLTIVDSFVPTNLTWITHDISSHKDQTTIIGYHWDFLNEFDTIGADIHILGHEHRNYIEQKTDYTRIVTGKTYYSYAEEKGAIRELKFKSKSLIEYPLWDITDTEPVFTTSSRLESNTTFLPTSSLFSNSFSNMDSSSTPGFCICPHPMGGA